MQEVTEEKGNPCPYEERVLFASVALPIGDETELLSLHAGIVGMIKTVCTR